MRDVEPHHSTSRLSSDNKSDKKQKIVPHDFMGEESFAQTTITAEENDNDTLSASSARCPGCKKKLQQGLGHAKTLASHVQGRERACGFCVLSVFEDADTEG